MVSLCNLLGPICPTYRFADGGVIRRTTRESVAYERQGKVVDVELYYDGAGGYEYYLPESLSELDRAEMQRRMDEYCANKRYKIVKRG